MTDTLAATTSRTYLRTPTADRDLLFARFSPLFAQIAEGNVDRERSRTFPYTQVDLLKTNGFGLLRIPEEFGGYGASLEQTFDLLAALAAADPNVAHVWRNHLAFVEDRLNAPRSAATDRWLARFRDGEFVGGGWTEANNGTFANIATTVRRDGDVYRVDGAKFYATGSLYADWLDVIGASEDGLLTALVRRDDPGVELTDDWTGFGQQTTASGSATYAGAAVDPDDVFGITERFVYQGHFYQVAILAVLTGITAAAVREATTALRARARNYPQAADQTPTRDPQLLQVIGEADAHGFGAAAALSAAARDLDAVAAAHAAGDLDARTALVRAAQLSTDRAQLVIIEHALTATTEVFDALGASGVSSSIALDRHWRNARTLASHNPRVYKARIVGDWLVNGTDPVPVLGGIGGPRGGQGN